MNEINFNLFAFYSWYDVTMNETPVHSLTFCYMNNWTTTTSDGWWCTRERCRQPNTPINWHRALGFFFSLKTINLCERNNYISFSISSTIWLRRLSFRAVVEMLWSKISTNKIDRISLMSLSPSSPPPPPPPPSATQLLKFSIAKLKSMRTIELLRRYVTTLHLKNVSLAARHGALTLNVPDGSMRCLTVSNQSANACGNHMSTSLLFTFA